jgi:hypothetical protein
MRNLRFVKRYDFRLLDRDLIKLNISENKVAIKMITKTCSYEDNLTLDDLRRLNSEC